MKNYRSVAVELIAHQTDGFAAKLTEAFADLHAIADPAEAQRSEPCKRIVKMTRERFGLKIALLVETDSPPGCLAVVGHTNHALVGPQIIRALVPDPQQNIEKALMLKPNFKGTIDLKKAKVGGDYCDLTSVVAMGQTWCRSTHTPAESAAAYLHEIGHCFVALEFMWRTARCSQLLASMHQVRTGRDTSVTYVYAVKKVAGRLYEEGILQSPHEFEEMVEMQDDAAIVSLAYARTWRKLSTDFGSSVAAGPNFEALADDFAVKFGLGPELLSGLRKMSDDGIDDGGLSLTLTYLNSMIAPLSLGILPAYAAAAVGASLAVVGGVGAVVAASMAALFLSLGGHNEISIVSHPYGKDMTRLNRVRECTIGFLKQADLTPDARAHYLNQIKVIDTFIKGRTDAVSFWDDLANLIFSSRREAKHALKLERDLELLANNNLFLGASALKQLA